MAIPRACESDIECRTQAWALNYYESTIIHLMVYAILYRASSPRAVGPADNSMQRGLHELNGKGKYRALGPTEPKLNKV
ncbi:hypothetical protein LNTAR_07439 [Lentisphaera araneosa HTCC2155]|uniref:Uncharacterized protein n=1 Tax=Lentisphaera araneosa HTCC2155 TaxID=313628 RepID=A6DN23_9BACT|nr:hypothetical protein LNTAR_07439 [Lentisphaera araneosa HTCC2155]